MASSSEHAPLLPLSMRARLDAWLCGVLGYVVLAVCVAGAVSLLSWSAADPSLTHATSGPTRNLMGPVGAIYSDLVMQLFGLAGVFSVLPPLFWGLQLVSRRRLEGASLKVATAPMAIVLLACAASSLPSAAGWPLPGGFGGLLGDQSLRLVAGLLAMLRPDRASAAAGLFCFAGGLLLLMTSLGLSQEDLRLVLHGPRRASFAPLLRTWRRLGRAAENEPAVRREPTLRMPPLLGPGEPAFDQPMRISRPAGLYYPAPHGGQMELPQTPHGDLDPATEEAWRIARRFAPRGGEMQPAGGPEPQSVDYFAAAPAAAMQTADVATVAEGAAGDPYADPMAPGLPMHDREPDAWPPTAGGALVVPVSAHAVPPRQGGPGDDALYQRAVAIVLAERKASTGYLQRRLALGYMRAADLIERMEAEGIIGGPTHGGLRRILV
jgi:hypothetical protein